MAKLQAGIILLFLVSSAVLQVDSAVEEELPTIEMSRKMLRNELIVTTIIPTAEKLSCHPNEYDSCLPYIDGCCEPYHCTPLPSKGLVCILLPFPSFKSIM